MTTHDQDPSDGGSPPTGHSSVGSGRPMDDHIHDPIPRAAPRRPARWPYFLVGLFLILGFLVLALWPLKVPYYAMAPGPVEEVADLVIVTDSETFLPDGDLYLLTVGLREVNVFEYIEAHFDEQVDLIETRLGLSGPEHEVLVLSDGRRVAPTDGEEPDADDDGKGRDSPGGVRLGVAAGLGVEGREAERHDPTESL